MIYKIRKLCKFRIKGIITSLGNLSKTKWKFNANKKENMYNFFLKSCFTLVDNVNKLFEIMDTLQIFPILL